MDIRLTRGRNQRVWLWTAGIVGIGLLAIVAAALFGDPTERGNVNGVGAAARFGADRAPVLPVLIEPFGQVKHLTDRELGRLLHVTGNAESGVRREALYLRAVDGRRILVRFEPAPPEGRLSSFYPGAAVNLNGYLQKISRAEFEVWMDSLGVVIPRPAPGIKFGDLPDSNFVRVDSLFVKDFYISVRPEGILRRGEGAATTAPARPASQPARPAAPRVQAPPAAAPVPAPVAPAADSVPD